MNFFTAANLIHPDIRDADPTSLARTDNYRGKYPHLRPMPEGEGGEYCAPDGEDYPLTNKLDYAFFKRRMVRTTPGGQSWVEEKVDCAAAQRTPFEDPWRAERDAKRAQAKKDWPRQEIYPEESFYYVAGPGGLKLRHGLRFCAGAYKDTTAYQGGFRVGRDR